MNLRALDALLQVASTVILTTRVFDERNRYIRQYGYRPTDIVMSRHTYQALVMEASTIQRMTLWELAQMDSKNIFGMQISYADIPDGEFFVGGER